MKIIFDETDYECAKGYENRKYNGFLSQNGKYSLNLEVTDHNKANSFLMQVFGEPETVKLLKEKAGLQITSINFYEALSKEEIHGRLHKMIDEWDF